MVSRKVSRKAAQRKASSANVMAQLEASGSWLSEAQPPQNQQEKGELGMGQLPLRQSVFNESRWQLARVQSSLLIETSCPSSNYRAGEGGQSYF